MLRSDTPGALRSSVVTCPLLEYLSARTQFGLSLFLRPRDFLSLTPSLCNLYLGRRKKYSTRDLAFVRDGIPKQLPDLRYFTARYRIACPFLRLPSIACHLGACTMSRSAHPHGLDPDNRIPLLYCISSSHQPTYLPVRKYCMPWHSPLLQAVTEPSHQPRAASVLLEGHPSRLEPLLPLLPRRLHIDLVS